MAIFKNNQSILSINDDNIYQIIDHVNASIYWKDLKGVYLGCNQYMLQMLNINDRQLVIGKTDYQLGWSDVADIITKHDKIAIEQGIYTVEESFINHNGEHKFYLTEKSRLLDENGNIIGLMGTSMNITPQKELDNLRLSQLKALQIFQKSIDDIFTVLHKNQIQEVREKISYAKTNTRRISNLKLTKREQEIVYFLSVGKSPKEIANILSAMGNKDVSFKTVLSIINKKLYPKFEVFSVGELIDSARLHGLIPFLPQGFYSSVG